jgi:phage head maturation protease
VRHTTDTIGSLRAAEGDDPLIFEGVAVPYGQLSVSRVPEYGKREAFAPGAFAGSVNHWMTRQDGAKLAFRPEHGAKPNGVVTVLGDTPDGVSFRLNLFDTPAGHESAQQFRSGLNGVSIEFNPIGTPVQKGEYVVHREAKLYGIAGSVTPAYDGARLSLRDMEDNVPETVDTTDTAPVTPPPAERAAGESAQVAAIMAGVTPATVTITRAEAQYGRDATDERGQWRSFLKDFYLAHNGDSGAMERQEKHNRQLADIGAAMARAGDVLSSEIPGAYPNLYLPGVFQSRILKSRPMTNFIGSYPIDNALPRIFAKVSTSTSATVQASQTTNPAASDFATTAVTATPLLYGASSLVARQVVDGASPAAETMLLQDMYEAYGQVTEAATVTAVEAGASASGTAITAATPWAGTLGNVIKYQATRFNPAEGQFYPSALYSVLLSQGDTTGRPFMPMIGLMNSDGQVAAGAISGGILGAQTILSWGSTVNVVVTLRRADYVAFESPTLSFRYEQATGPAGFNIGVWGYFVVAARLGGLSVTAA